MCGLGAEALLSGYGAGTGERPRTETGEAGERQSGPGGSVTERGRRTAVERHVPSSRCQFSRHRTGQEEGEPGKGPCS